MVIDKMDISETQATYNGDGTSNFRSWIVLKMIANSHMCNIYSSVEWSDCYTKRKYLRLSDMSHPNLCTINRFRSEDLCDDRFEELLKVVEAVPAEDNEECAAEKPCVEILPEHAKRIL